MVNLLFETTGFLEEMIQGYYDFCQRFVSYDGEL